MLLHNGGSGYLQPSAYYPEPNMYVPNYATSPPTHFDVDLFTQAATQYTPHPPSPPQPHHQAYYQASSPTATATGYTHHHHGYRSCGASSTCACPPVPVQDTFLHKILTGKGYKNNAMCVDHGPSGSLYHYDHHSHHHHHHQQQHSPQPYDQLEQLFNDYAMAASCCYSGLSALAMSDSYPASIPRIS